MYNYYCKIKRSNSIIILDDLSMDIVKLLFRYVDENDILCNYQLQSSHNRLETLGVFSTSNKVWNKQYAHACVRHMLTHYMILVHPSTLAEPRIFTIIILKKIDFNFLLH